MLVQISSGKVMICHVRLGYFRLGQVSSYYVRIFQVSSVCQVMIGYIRVIQVMTFQVRLDQFMCG
jgi:hypothetical protein